MARAGGEKGTPKGRKDRCATSIQQSALHIAPIHVTNADNDRLAESHPTYTYPPPPTMDITDEHIDDDEVLASLWEEWKASLKQRRGWTSAAQWATSDSVGRDPLHPRRITHLDLRDCLLTGPVPSSIGHLSSLRMLYLDHNELTSLPPEVGQLSSLQWLDLSGNQLTSLPPEIGHLSSLRMLHLDHNELTSLPPEVGQLSSLQWLDLSGNQLTSLPPEIGHLSSLRELHLGNNCLIRIPSLPSTVEIRGGSEKDQRLPAMLEATTTTTTTAVTSNNELKGDALVAEAEKRMSGGGGVDNEKDTTAIEAAELYEEAAPPVVRPQEDEISKATLPFVPHQEAQARSALLFKALIERGLANPELQLGKPIPSLKSTILGKEIQFGYYQLAWETDEEGVPLPDSPPVTEHLAWRASGDALYAVFYHQSGECHFWNNDGHTGERNGAPNSIIDELHIAVSNLVNGIKH